MIFLPFRRLDTPQHHALQGLGLSAGTSFGRISLL